MAALHEALTSLGPIPWSSVPHDRQSLTAYIQSAFQSAQTILDSVPLPPPPSDVTVGRSRANTSASEASNVSEISSSSARSDPLDPTNAPLQKEWGRPIKLNAKDNPLGMSVYKLGGKDGRGAWFARRSVHEGLGFKKWKLGLQREFPETLEVQGGPGEGNIRGIGGERRVERERLDGVGAVEVYHLSAQFPGPTTPRDFVTLLLTSSSAIGGNTGKETGSRGVSSFSEPPNHFMVISRPCEHPDCPHREGFIRGQYESIEFIREIPRKSRKSASATDLKRFGRASTSVGNEAILRDSTNQNRESAGISGDGTSSASPTEETVKEGRQRGKTISFAESRGVSAKGEKLDNSLDCDSDSDEDLRPVEWIMITRSDPGGSVPRFMVERGTPGGIVADASKFLDWAAKKEHTDSDIEALDKGIVIPITETEGEGLQVHQTEDHLGALDGAIETPANTNIAPAEDARTGLDSAPIPGKKQEGVIASMTSAAVSNLEAYAPQALLNRLPAHGPSQFVSSDADPSATIKPPSTRGSSSASSIASFASAEDHFDDAESTKSMASPSQSTSSKDKMSPHEKELARFNERKRLLHEKLMKAKEKETRDKQELSTREEERIRKAEEKHAKEVAKQEEKYRKEVAKLDAKRQRDEAKEVDKRKKAEERDEKARLTKEKEDLKRQVDTVSEERDLLKEQVGALQKENTSLVMRLGKMERGQDIGNEVEG